MTNGRPSRATSCTAPGSRPTARTTTRSAGSPSGTAMITFTSSRCWPARTAAARPVVGRYQVRDACQAAEERYGLRPTAPGDRTAARRPTRAENEKAARHGLDEAPRITLRRQVTTAAAGAASEQEFFARLDQAGVLVRNRFSTRNPGQVTGYAVALPGDTAKDGGPVWFGGGKLAAGPDPAQAALPLDAVRVAPGAARRLTERAERDLGACRPRRRRRRRADPHPGRDDPAPSPTLPGPPPTPCTWPPPYSAAGSCARPPTPTTAPPAAPYGRVPPAHPGGNSLRQAARLLSAFAYLTGGGRLSAAHYADARSALADARRRQYTYPNGRIEPAERVLFVLAMQALGISACH